MNDENEAYFDSLSSQISQSAMPFIDSLKYVSTFWQKS